MPLTTRETARAAIRAGFQPVLVDPSTKKPSQVRWQEIVHTEETVDGVFVDGMSVGLRWGTSYHGARHLVDCDLEEPTVVAFGDLLLPDTDVIWGREGNHRSHRVYEVEASRKLKKFKDHEGGLLAELRGERTQSVIPDSAYPGESGTGRYAGTYYSWDSTPFGTPTKIDYADLDMLIRLVVLGAALAERWADCGGRHDAALGLGGFLAKLGVGYDQASLMLGCILRIAGDDEADDRITALTGSYEALENGAEVSGFGKLEEVFGQEFARWAMRMFNVELPPEARAYNEKPFNDLGNARWFAELQGDNCIYVTQRKTWASWDGKRWYIEPGSQEHRRRAHDTLTKMRAFAKDQPKASVRTAMMEHIMYSENHKQIDAMIAEAAALLERPENIFDQQHYLINLLNGTYNLEKGEFSEHSRQDFLTKVANVEYDPKAECPTWTSFISTVMHDNPEMIRYMQKIAGYVLSADTSEQCMFFLYGVGRNGKSTYIETIAHIMGEYAAKTPIETFMAKRGDQGGIPNDIARLNGIRFVSARETEQGRYLAESVIKDVTGEDKISARYLHAEWFDFKPVLKLLLYGNHKPLIRGTDEGIKSRVRMIPFSVFIPPERRDPDLRKKLEEEAPGILNWMIEGYQLWRAERLGMPEAVTLLTDDYFSSMDVIGEFVNDHYDVSGGRGRVRLLDVYNAYVAWCMNNGEQGKPMRTLTNMLVERGWKKTKANGDWYWMGVRELGGAA